MDFKPIESYPISFRLFAFIWCMCLLLSCGSSTSNDSVSDTGALSFRVIYHDADGNHQPRAALIDCAGLGVSNVEAAVYDSNDALLQSGGPWNCKIGRGTISSVPAGSGRNVVILGKDSVGDAIFRGTISDIQVDAYSENDIGTIACYSFVPVNQVPSNGSVVNADSMGLAWNAVTGAAKYHVRISESSDLSTTIIDEPTADENYTPVGLSNALTYYWQVVAVDAYGNMGIESQILSFTVDAQHQNTLPTAQITSPAPNSIFTAGDEITFAGNGSDSEDGDIEADFLTWRSDLDNQIGTGQTITTSTLTIGTHQMTFTAIDTEGAKGTATVTITVNPAPANTPPTAQITSPETDSIFSTEDSITFSGSGSDNEDGALSGQALEWRSNLDGPIGTGETFNTSALSAGTHQIELTATDSGDTTGKDSITITVNDLGPHGIMHLDYENDVGMYSAIAVEDGKIFVAYYDETNEKLKVARSLNDGHDWSFSTVESDNDAGKGSSIALDGNNVFISTTINHDRIGISKSSDNGDTWNTSTILPDHARASNAAFDEFATSIAIDGQNIYITFLSSDVLCLHLLKSTYSANDWEILPIRLLLDDPETGYYSSINEYNGTLYISHSGYEVADVYLERLSNDLSNTTRSLVDEIGVRGDKGYTSSAVRQVDDNIYIYVAYYDQSDGNTKLKFGRSVNGGDIFSSKTIDDSSAVIGKYPSMAIYGNTIFVAYYDETNGNLKIARSSDHGDTWDIDPVDSDTDNVGRFASLGVDGPKVYISYYDDTNKNLKFAKSIDGGDTWE